MSKTVTDELAVLLRKAAEKWPEKFKHYNPPVGEVVEFKGTDKKYWDVWLESLDLPRKFTLDHMDAIAGAVGMWFDCHHSVDDEYADKYTARWGECHSKTALDSTPWNFTKRSASIAALCAILKYKLEIP